MLFTFGVVFLAVLGAFYFVFVSSSGKNERAPASNPRDQFDELRKRVEKALSTPEAINASIERNPNPFACLLTTIGDCTGKGGTFLFYETADSSGQPISQLATDAGTDGEGIGCMGFPSESCPFRVEAIWTPVCAPGKCEKTKSLKAKAKVTYIQAGVKDAPIEWEKEEFFTPNLKLSRAVQCERNGGTWALTECLSGDQMAARNIAPTKSGINGGLLDQGFMRHQAQPQEPEQQPQEEYICPDTIVVQGQYYTLEQLAAGRAQVRVPAINGCPAEDTFVFQCVAKNPPQFVGEGQWVQVEAVMAPNCEINGSPIGEEIRN